MTTPDNSDSQTNVQKVRSRTGTGALSKDSAGYWRKKIRLRPESPYYFIELQHEGIRKKFSLKTSIPVAAAQRAKEVSLFVRANGWDAALQHYERSKSPKLASGSSRTVGEYIERASKLSGAQARSQASYAKSLRHIVADLLDVAGNRAKHGNGRAAKRWRKGIDDTPLSWLTEERVREWKSAYLSKGKQDPVSMRSKRVSVNGIMRQAKSLFSKRILKNIGFPVVNPFADVEFEARQSTKYRGTIDARELFETAQDSLAGDDPEAFKVFLLGLCGGLRRKEIDLLEWKAFRWTLGVVRLETTEHLSLKSEDSGGDVALDAEVLELFRGYRARATGSFVIESPFEPRPEARYAHYRCEPVFKRLTDWLRKHGVRSRKPLHELRKEFGSLVNQQYGIYAASMALRHADLKVTQAHYVENRTRATIGLGSLLKSDDGKVTPITTGTTINAQQLELRVTGK